MAKFIVCDFHGTEPKNNAPVNLDMVQFIETPAGNNFIEFNFRGSDKLIWEFEDSTSRNLEYDRIIGIATEED